MRSALSLLFVLTTLSLCAPAWAGDDATKQLTVGITTLKLMRDKGIITQGDYDSAMREMRETVGAQAASSTTLMVSKFSVTLYGFVEADLLWDSTQSFNDLAGNGQVKRPGTYAGDHGRFTFGVRNSRIGFRIGAPEWHHIRASAVLEMDFLGNQAGVGYDQAYKISEGAYFTSPAFRLRHGFLKLETPWFDVLAGQTWQLFGWQPMFQPNTVEIQGVPGELYSRTPQLRLSKIVRTRPITFEATAAMMRSPERDSSTPEGQFGLRLAVNKWTAVQTVGSTGTTVSPLSFAVTADVRHFEVPSFAASPPSSPSVSKTGWGVAADAFVPVIPGRKDKMGNSLALTGEYAWGYGTADLYTGLNGGVGNAKLPPDMTGMSPAFSPVADPALVDFSADGKLHLIQWQSWNLGAQYYFPKLDGRMWVSANYSHMGSNNARNHGAATATRKGEDWVDANLFGDLTPAVRLGLEYAWFDDHYTDGKNAINHRVQLSAFYLF